MTIQDVMEEQHVSVRLKYGIHTIYMFIDLTQPMSAVKAELLSLLRERYPAGLKSRIDDPETFEIPEKDDDTYLALGTIAAPNDRYAGWKRLMFDEDQTAGRAGLKQNSIVAFTFVENADEEPLFIVEWPKEDLDEEAGDELGSE